MAITGPLVDELDSIICCSVVYHDGRYWSITPISRNFRNCGDMFTALSNFTKYCMNSVEVCWIAILWDDEELAPARVWIACFRHGNHA